MTKHQVASVAINLGPKQSVPGDRCIECRAKFSSENTFTDAGWRETQISGLCERCFDQLFEEED